MVPISRGGTTHLEREKGKPAIRKGLGAGQGSQHDGLGGKWFLLGKPVKDRLRNRFKDVLQKKNQGSSKSIIQTAIWRKRGF